MAFIVVLSTCGSALAFDAFQATGIDRRAGATLPLDLAFQDESGRPTTLRQAGHGKPIVLAPVVHRCPNICGLTLAGLAQTAAGQKFVAGRDFTIVAFGIDPREGPADARQSLDKLRQSFPSLRHGILGFTGTERDIKSITDRLGYRYGWDDDLQQYAHIAAVAVLTPDGRLSRWLYGIAPDPVDLRLALTEAGNGKIGTWGDQLLLLCYHYDPQTGRYGSLIWTALRIGGAITVVAAGGLIGLAILRERRRLQRDAP
ncbi:SCO family protein [Enhydrobacter sp.]|uniref:SCO family protein n=1 Tax=Enhydrobacter sp. TaxID=1894999 RepID=UPI0026361A06|nr:SCO family protein [Enhydrobacter sp.]